jgi:hypothetical protein
MCPGRWQRAVTAGAVRGQPCPTVRAELPVRCNLAVAVEALLDELVKLLMELQEGGLPPALVGLLRLCFAVHCVPSVSHWNDLTPRTPAEAASCTDAVPDSATDRRWSRYESSAASSSPSWGLLLSSNYRHDTEESSQTQPPCGRPDALAENNMLSLSSHVCCREEHKTCQPRGLPDPLSSRVEKRLQDR